MPKRDIVDDLADIVHPYPEPAPADSDENEHDAVSALASEIDDLRRAFEGATRLEWEEGNQDPLLGLIAHERAVMRAAEERLRYLIAYGREFVSPRPYRLDDLARAAEMSISGTRTAYGDEEITQVASLLGRQPRDLGA
ncbi:MAG TPA: hypothetical protein VLL08_18430 [Kineosporiaceae bacterium]|nr:hypothetical protein [Kineosporiaceae bacterium]